MAGVLEVVEIVEVVEAVPAEVGVAGGVGHVEAGEPLDARPPAGLPRNDMFAIRTSMFPVVSPNISLGTGGSLLRLQEWGGYLQICQGVKVLYPDLPR